MMETKDKTALVTGAASGMGAAAARMFAQAGYSVMLADMNGTAVEAAVQGLAASGYEADYTVCYVTDEAQVKAMVERRWQGSASSMPPTTTQGSCLRG